MAAAGILAAEEDSPEGIMKYIYIALLLVFVLYGCSGGGVRTGAAVNKRIGNNVSVTTGVWR